MKYFKYLLVLLLLAAVGCQFSAQSYSGLSIDMSVPHTSTYISALGINVPLRADGINDQNNSMQITFYASGRNIGNVTDFALPDPKPEGTLDWMPTAAGEYFVQVQLHRSSNPQNAFSAAVRVCILDAGAVASQARLWGYGYSGPCTIPPAPTVPRGTSTAVTIHATAHATNPPAGGSGVSLPYFTDACTHPVDGGALEDTIITFNATVNDPSGQVAFVTVRYQLTGGGLFDSVVLNQTGGGPTGTRTYSGNTIELNTSLAAALGGAPGTISWEARALDRSGNMIAHEDHTMLVGPCTPPVHPLTIASATPTLGIIIIPPTATNTLIPTATDTSTLTLTFTPASAADCPSGTYYADATHQCIAIATPTTSNGSNGGNSCSLSLKSCYGKGYKHFDPVKCVCY